MLPTTAILPLLRYRKGRQIASTVRAARLIPVTSASITLKFFCLASNWRMGVAISEGARTAVAACDKNGCWALALNRANEYACAGVPMLPVVAGRAATKRQILIYSILLVLASALPLALSFAGALYGASAVIDGTILIALAVQLSRSSESDRRAAHRLFLFSIFYLFVSFAALLADRGGDLWSSRLLSHGIRVGAVVRAELRPQAARSTRVSINVRGEV